MSLRLSAIRAQLGAHLHAFGPAKEQNGRVVGGDELCLRDSSSKNLRVSLFREPRSHVLSQYLECRGASWAIAARDAEAKGSNHAAFATNAPLVSGFAAWLRGFVANGTHHGFGCYAPWNMQARCAPRRSHADLHTHTTATTTTTPGVLARARVCVVAQCDDLLHQQST